MKVWRRATALDRCQSCADRHPFRPEATVLEVVLEQSGRHLVFCEHAAQRIFSDAPPAVLPSAPSLAPQPGLPIDGLYVPSSQAFISAGELAQRQQRTARWAKRHRAQAAPTPPPVQASDDELPESVTDSPLYRPRGVREALAERERVVGEEG